MWTHGSYSPVDTNHNAEVQRYLHRFWWSPSSANKFLHAIDLREIESFGDADQMFWVYDCAQVDQLKCIQNLAVRDASEMINKTLADFLVVQAGIDVR